MTKQEKIAHKIIGNILKNYPTIKSMETQEDRYGAIVKLELGGFRKGNTTHYTYPREEVAVGK